MTRSALVGLAAVVMSAAALPLACFFPEYTFNEGDGSDGGSGPSGPSTGGGGPSTGGGGPSTGGGGPSTGGAGGQGASGGGGSGAEGGGGSGVGGMPSTSSSGGMGGMPSTSSSGGMGGGSGVGEICDNGIDDDGDNKTDCQDPECTDYSCVDAIPQGWSGYYALYDGAIAGAPGCGGDYPNQSYSGNAGLDAPPAMCSACSCGNPQGQVCTPAAELHILDAVCGAQSNCYGPLPLGPADNSCNGNGGFTGDLVCGPGCPMGSDPCNLAVTAGPATVQGGACPPTIQAPNVTPATWTKLGRACGGAPMTAGGCGGGQQCMPKPAAPFESNVCISHVGDVACPAGAFVEKHVFYAGFMDTRTCTNCSCSAPFGATCSVDVAVYSNGTCTGAPLATFEGGTCANLAGNPTVWGRKVSVKTPVSGGTCTALGGQPVGAATPQTPTTFCCIP